MDEVKHAPSVDTDKPVSRQHESEQLVTAPTLRRVAPEEDA
jgi:hypothetical protein